MGPCFRRLGLRGRCLWTQETPPPPLGFVGTRALGGQRGGLRTPPEPEGRGRGRESAREPATRGAAESPVEGLVNRNWGWALAPALRRPRLRGRLASERRRGSSQLPSQVTLQGSRNVGSWRVFTKELPRGD